jgi:DNA replicative helicase MCM subunit Mcm2 (Cdc46/Mcm family)
MKQTEPRGIEVRETTFTCKDCGAEFYLSIEEQESLKARHLELPKRCVDCRRKRRHSRQNSNGDYRTGNQKPFDVADFDRVMGLAREAIKKWQ